MPDNKEFDKSVTRITDEKEYHNWRLTIAANAVNGLLASQNEKGWNLGVLATVALRAADAFLEVASRPLPELTSAQREPKQEPQVVELEVLDTPEPSPIVTPN